MSQEVAQTGLSEPDLSGWSALRVAISGPGHEENAVDRADLFAQLGVLVASDPVRGVLAAQAAVGVVDGTGTVEQQVHARRLLAMALAHSNRFDEALAICTEAERLPGAPTVPIEIARVRLASMQPLVVVGRVEEAIRTGEAALETLSTEGSEALAGRAALNLGATLAMTGRPAAALPHFERASTYLADDPVLLGQIATNQGTALAALDRFQEAEAAFQRAVDLLNTEEMAWSAAIVHGNLADLAARQGAIQRSLYHFEASRRLLERDGALGDLGRLNAEEATVLDSLGLTTDSSAAFVEAIALLSQHGTSGDLIMGKIAYGSSLIASGATREATALMDDVRAGIDPDEQPELYQRFLALDAQLALSDGRFDDAERLVTAGLAALPDRPVQQVPWLLMRAELAHRTGHDDLARESLMSALQIASRARVTPLVAEIQSLLAANAADEGDQVSADRHARQAVETIESVRGTIQADRLRQSFHHQRLDIYAALYRSLIRQQGAEVQHEAFGLAERMRSRTLQDALAIRNSDVDAPDSGDPAEQPLIEELTEHRRWLNWMYSSMADGLEPDSAQQEELAFRERAAGVVVDRLAVIRPRPGIDAPRPLADIQEELDPDTVIFSYLVVDGTVTLQTITTDRVEGVAHIASTRDVAELVTLLQFQIGRQLATVAAPPSPSRTIRLQRDVERVLEQLYDLLVRPVQRRLEGRLRMVVVPSGDLHGVPFAALLSAGSYLIDRLAIVTAPAVNVLMSTTHGGPNRDRGHSEPRRPLIVGVPDETAPGLGLEAEALAARFSGGTSLIGEAATRSVVLAAMADADLIHLACHGRFDPTHPNASGLRMTDGWLTLDQLLDIRLDQPLVLLSGCETGRVRVDRGDELVGIMATLIGAGASGLVTSLWKTQDDAAAALIASFYDLQLAGADPITALQAAQRHVRRTFPHPACWAPFVVATSTAINRRRRT